MKVLNLDLLRTLTAIEEHGGFAIAAMHLDLTQSAVTQQMQRLEDQIGRPLFEKHGRQKNLSPHGKKLLDYARHLLSINDEALRSFAHGQLEGSLRIAAPHDVADTLLPQVLTQIARASPRLQVDIEVGRSPLLMESLNRGDIDMVISNRHDPSHEGVVLRRTPTAWLCSANYVHDRNMPVPLILIDGPSLFHRLAREALEAARIPWTATYTARNLMGMKAALRAGLGVAARGIELVGAEMRVLGESEGLPRLPDVTYFLYIRQNVFSTVTRHVFELLKTNMGLLENEPQRLFTPLKP